MRKFLRAIVVGLAAVAVGVATNQVLNGGKWDLPWLVGAILLAALAEGINLWVEARDQARRREARGTEGRGSGAAGWRQVQKARASRDVNMAGRDQTVINHRRQDE